MASLVLVVYIVDRAIHPIFKLGIIALTGLPLALSPRRIEVLPAWFDIARSNVLDIYTGRGLPTLLIADRLTRD